MPTVIDSLLVTLGLDPKGFEKGAEDAARAQDKLKDSAHKGAESVTGANTKAGASAQKVGKEREAQAKAEEKRQKEAERAAKQRSTDEKKRADQSIGNLKSVGLYAAAAVIGFDSLKGAVEAYAATVATMTAAGRLAPTIGVSVAELGSLGKAYNAVGGKVEDAAQDFGKLSAAQTSVLLHAPDALAGWARRLGVSLFDSGTGKQRDKVAILKDIGAQLRSQTNDQQAQANIARQMGLSEAAIQLFVTKQADERDKILDQAAELNRLTADTAAKTEKLSKAWAKLGNTITGAKESFVAATAPYIAKGVDYLSTGANEDQSKQLAFYAKVANAVGLKSFGGFLYQGAEKQYDAAFSSAEKKYGLRPGQLAALAKQESNFNADAVNKKSGAKGLMQLNPKYFPNAGKDTRADIDSAAAELQRLYQGYKKKFPQFSDDKLWNLALTGYNDGAKALQGHAAGKSPLPDEAANYAAQVNANMQRNANFAAGASAPPAAGGGTKPGSGGGGGGQSVQIDAINIVTQATDSNGIASTIAPAVQRKGVVAQANGGLN